jgi:hypothetical protein
MHALLLMLAVTVTPSEVQAVRADRAQVEPLAAHRGFLVYFSTSHLEGEQRAACEAALAYSVAGASQQQVVERCVPAKVSDTLWRCDLRELGWGTKQFFDVVKEHDYYGASHYVYAADRFVVELSDATESDAYMLLLYGKAQITRDEYLKIWGANNDPTTHFGVIALKEAGSPNVAPVRYIERRPTDTGFSAWGTRDSAKIDFESDPLQHLDRGFKHQAEEWLVAMPKVSSYTGERTFLLAPFLANNKGVQQKEAPPAIVTDHSAFRGQAAIRFPAGCASCHTQGINPPSLSEFRSYIADGVQVYAKDKKLQEQVDLFWSTKPGKQIRRDNEDIQDAIRAINGLDGAANAEALIATIDYYDGNLTLIRAAAELHCQPKELELALGYATLRGVNLPVRLAGLPHGHSVPRATWEQVYPIAYEALKVWEKSTEGHR